MSTGRYRVQRPGATGKVLRVLLLCTGAAALVGDLIAFDFLRRHAFVLHVPTTGDPYFTEPFPASGSGWFMLFWVQSLVSQATIVLWLVWQHQATANLWASGRTRLRVTPGWAVGWWFVPVANLWMPLIAMREVDRRSSADDAPRKASPLLAAWWAAWLASSLAPIVGVVAVALPKIVDWGRSIDERAITVDISPMLRAIAPWIVVAGVLQCLAAVLAVLVVGRIEAAQDELTGVGALPPRPDVP